MSKSLTLKWTCLGLLTLGFVCPARGDNWSAPDGPMRPERMLRIALNEFAEGQSATNQPNVPMRGQTAPPRDDADPKAHASTSRYKGLITGLTIFVLAIFVGFEVITKVPPTLHTPLMSGSNAISGITLVGAVIVAGAGLGFFASFIGMLAVALATVNVIGGFLVTHRMLAMFKKR